MLHLKYALRKPKKPVFARGPIIPQQENITLNIDNLEVNIRMPRHRAEAHVKQIPPIKSLSLNSDLEQYKPSQPDWKCKCLLARSFDFYGPWLTGTLGRINSSINILKQEGMQGSLLHPNALEACIGDFLKYKFYNEELEQELQDWFGPINWKPLESTGIISVNFCVIANQTNLKLYDILVMPISEKHFLMFSNFIFRDNVFISSSTTPESDIEKWVPIAPFMEFSKEILDSITVTYSENKTKNNTSPSALTRAIKLSKEYPPIHWVKNSPVYTPYLSGIPNKN